MQERHTRPVQGRTRWRRFAVVTVPAVAATGAIMVAMANGAIAASFAVSGSTFKVSASDLSGTGFVQFGSTAAEKGATATNGKAHPVAVAGIGDATITKMCQSVMVPGLPIGIKLTAGDAGTGAHATALTFDMTDMTSDSATFQNLNIGQDATTLTKVKDAHGNPIAAPAPKSGDPGPFGQQADTVHLVNVHQTAWAASAGTFTLPNLHLSVFTGGGVPNECF